MSGKKKAPPVSNTGGAKANRTSKDSSAPIVADDAALNKPARCAKKPADRGMAEYRTEGVGSATVADAPLLRTLLDAEDFRGDDGEEIYLGDLQAEFQHFSRRTMAERFLKAMKEVAKEAAVIDLRFVLKATRRWRKCFGADRSQPGALAASIFRGIELTNLAEGVAEDRSQGRAMAAARKRLTAAGVPFREDPDGGDL